MRTIRKPVAASIILLLHITALHASAGWLTAWGWDKYGQVSNAPTGGDFVAVSAGGLHNVALKSDGSLTDWGSNQFGQLNNTPTGGGFAAIAAGAYHSVALKTDGSLVAWGEDTYDAVSTTPGGNDFAAIAAGQHYSIALKTDGSLVAWGTKSTAPAGNDFVAVSAGGILKSDGSVVNWSGGQILAGNDFVAVSARLALRSDGTLAAWGSDYYGQVTETPVGGNFVAVSTGGYHNVAIRSVLDEAPAVTSAAVPAVIVGQAYSYDVDATGYPAPTYSLVEAPSGMSINTTTGVITWVPSEAQLGAAQVQVLATNSVSSDTQAFMVTVRRPGSLVAWGRDEYGQVNDTPAGDEFVAVAAGGHHNVALKSDGSLVAWGKDDEWNRQVSDTPSGNDFIAVTAGYDHNIALRTDGSLIGWGHGGYGECDVPPGNNFMAVTTGFGHTVALKCDGWLTAWGYDMYGQVSNTPAGNGFVAITAGDSGFHTVALKSDGRLVAWGNNTYYGEVSNTPTSNDFKAVAAGARHSVALRTDGSLVSWGFDEYGQVSDTPAGSDFTAVAAGTYHSVALKTDGSLVAWGNDSAGQVSKTPAGNNFVAVSAGEYHSVAIAASAASTYGAPVYRFWSDRLKHHFYTISETEKDKLIGQHAAMWAYEGPAYRAFAAAGEPGTLPVYRFWSDRYGGHFYTINESEKDKLVTTYSHVWTYEGPVFYAYPEGSEPAETGPVYRFWSNPLNGHFYTISETEKDKLVTQYADVWAYEGIAWYAYE